MVMMSLSEMTPSARKTMKSGTGFLTFGIFTTIFLKVYFSLFTVCGATSFTDNVRIGFDTFSDTDRISAEKRYLSSPDLRIYNILSANFSWGTIVFSLPSIMKYPPTSLRHSPILNFTSRGNPLNTQNSDCNMIGNLPKYTFFNVFNCFNKSFNVSFLIVTVFLLKTFFKIFLITFFGVLKPHKVSKGFFFKWLNNFRITQ